MTNNTQNHIRAAGLCMTLFAGFHSPISAEELKFSLAADVDNLELGSGFAAAGDLNGDGIVDVAIADRSGRVDSRIGSGIVHLVSGADGSPIRNYVGAPAASQYFGAAMAALDADGDGIPDLAVGSPGQANAAGYGAGAVRIYSGADGSLLCSAVGPNAAQLGASIANAGDRNHDGFDDLFVGAPNANSSRGSVLVISGRDGATLREITTDASVSSFGISLASLGDIDSDGMADLAVGAPAFRVNGNQAGRVLLVRSSDGSIAAEIIGAGVYNRLGESLAAAADDNGDGFPDLLVGSYSGGTARLVSGLDLSTLADLSIPTLPLYRQLTVGGSLDFDSDGTADWLIGSPGLQIVNGQTVGGIRVVSGSDLATLFEYTTTAPYSGLGLTLEVLPGLGFAAGEANLQDPITKGSGLAHVWAVKEIPRILDTDGDGILDDVDAVLQSITDPTVVILGVDSKVANRVDATGMTIADRYATLGDPADFRCPALYYVKVLHLSVKLSRAKLIDKREALQISAAARKALLHTKRRR